jgi:hypothetical protein
MAYGNIYSNQGAMTPGASEETADGMSGEKINQITGLMRNERYRLSPADALSRPTLGFPADVMREASVVAGIYGT